MVLTHNAPASLNRCLSAVVNQDDPPAAILVVDMASNPPVQEEAIDHSISIRVIRSDENLGPAGGWAIAFDEFLLGPFCYAWVMDDDMVPELDCLSRLWEKAAKHEEPPFVFPLAQQRDGSLQQWGSWCGFLIAKEIVADVGVPNAELFWWAEDTEYTHCRIPEAGYPRRIARKALVHHDGIRQHDSVPTWKYYYETRNMIYLHMHVMHRVGRFPRNFSMLMARAFWKEHSGYVNRTGAIGRGVLDGVRGRLGVRYPVTALRERASRR